MSAAVQAQHHNSSSTGSASNGGNFHCSSRKQGSVTSKAKNDLDLDLDLGLKMTSASPEVALNKDQLASEDSESKQVPDTLTGTEGNISEKRDDKTVSMTVEIEMKKPPPTGDSAEESNGEAQPEFGLSNRIDLLQTTLNQVRRDTESEITKLRDELIEKNRTLERLQAKIKEQNELDIAKNQTSLKSTFPEVDASGPGQQFRRPSARESSLSPIALTSPGRYTEAGASPPVSIATSAPSPVNVSSASPLTMPPLQGAGQAPGGTPKGLEMFLIQRAKALQQANPALKALVDLQAANKPFGLGDLMKNPLLMSNQIAPPGGLPEDVLSMWRRNLEQSLLPPGLIPGMNQPPTSSSHLPPTPSPNSPSNRADTPERGPTPHERSISTPTTNGNESTPQTDDVPQHISSPIGVRMDLKSPFKGPEDSGSPLGSCHPASLFPPLPPAMMQQPPSFMNSGRIPKSDPIEGHLQDMLRYNMEKFAGQAIDTIGSARRVRELLSIHNIGQRLFAKYVLGLSQGTVSELLSKPKCWEKLTEKGRDSYRKMHAWAYDENAVMMLKSLIPRKGELSSSRSTRDLFTGMRAGFPGDPQGNKGPLGPGSGHLPLPLGGSPIRPLGGRDDPFARFGQPGGPGFPGARPGDFMGGRLPFPLPLDGKFDPTKRGEMDLPKLSDALVNSGSKSVLDAKSPMNLPLPPTSSGPDAVKDALQKLAFPGFAAAGLGGFMGKSPEEMQKAVEIYQQELIKLQQKALLQAGVPENKLPNILGGGSRSREGSEDGKDRDSLAKDNNNGESSDKPSSVTSVSPPPLSRLPLPGGVSPPKFSPSSFGPAGFLSSLAAGGAAAGALPPPPLIVDDVKPSSGASSVSSNSSASPLQGMASITNSLTSQPINSPYRPTQRSFKAILPPITQEQFDRYEHINTDELVRKIKEVLSQYSISQRLFGESVLGLSQGSVSDLLARPKQFHMLTQKGKEPFIRMKLFLDDEHAVHKLVASQYKVAPERLMRTGNYTGTYLPPTSLASMLPMGPGGPPGMHPFGFRMPPPGSDLRFPPTSAASVSAAVAALTGGAPPHPGGGDSPSPDPFAFQRKLQEQQRLAMIGGASSNVYEIAALTQELDTMQLTLRVKDVLSSNNIGQKHFGEAVLGLSQGSVSELLCKPKPWHMLSIKGREPFIRMQLWLNDPLNVEKLLAFRNEQESFVGGKRKRDSEHSGPVSPGSDEAYIADSPGSSGSSKKRMLFTTRQKESLSVAFSLDPYPNPSAVDFLAQELGLEVRSINNWFHNHRMRLKQSGSGDADSLLQNKEDQRPFDPLHFRLLVNQRILELETSDSPPSPGRNLPPSLASFPGLASLPKESLTALLSSSSAAALASMSAAGLDLSQAGKRFGAGDNDSTAAEDSKENEDEVMPLDVNNDEGSRASTSPPAVVRSSRRKPIAPQWVNPASATADQSAANGKSETADDLSKAKETGEDNLEQEN